MASRFSINSDASEGDFSADDDDRYILKHSPLASPNSISTMSHLFLWILAGPPEVGFDSEIDRTLCKTIVRGFFPYAMRVSW